MRHTFLKPLDEGFVQPIIGCPVHGPDKDKIVGYVSDKSNQNTAFLKNEDGGIISVVLLEEVPTHNCICKLLEQAKEVLDSIAYHQQRDEL